MERKIRKEGGCTKGERERRKGEGKREGKRKGRRKGEEKREAKGSGERLEGAVTNCKKKRTFNYIFQTVIPSVANCTVPFENFYINVPLNTF